MTFKTAAIVRPSPKGCATRVIAAALVGMEAGVSHVYVTGLSRNGAIYLSCAVNGQRMVSVRGR